MNIAHRFTLFVKGSFNNLLDSVEDPERSLHQLVLDMERQLEAAKRAAAQAIANERRLEERIEGLHCETTSWEEAAGRSVERGREDDARSALANSEKASRQAKALSRQLEAQQEDTEAIRRSVVRLHEQIESARSRLQLLQAKMRQGEARRAMGQAMRGVQAVHMMSEFDRLGERVELRAAEESAYLDLDDELSGADVRRRFEKQAMDDAVEDRLAALQRRHATSAARPGSLDPMVAQPEGSDPLAAQEDKS